MANTCTWYETRLPKDLIENVIDQMNLVDQNSIQDSKVSMKDPLIKYDIRKSKNSWIPTNLWIGGFLWHYIMKSNRENFLYDISNIENEVIQYTIYDKGDYYDWHTDEDISDVYEPDELVRKLSFTLQLSDDNEYTGGDLQFSDFADSKKKFTVPRSRGTMIVFDSRVPHRVCPIESGTRKTLVGWVMGKRWR